MEDKRRTSVPWIEVKPLFLQVAALPAKERAGFLDERCGVNPDLRREIESLLESEAKAPAFVDRPEVALGLAVTSAAEQLATTKAAGHPDTISDCRVMSLIGEGAFGYVYLAEQRSPRRRVAIKVLKPGHRSPQATRRLERESEIMARLHHPGIAQVFESGTLPGPDALPYFVMEYVEGKPISRYATDQRLPLAQRLSLFLEICDAVRHANANGVIHRDLKPANILVAADGRPKILDFGIARELDAELRERSMATCAGQLVGTLAYMSPEQAAGEPADSASDAYSLGVIVHELLTGRLPIEVDDQPLAEAIRRVLDHTPAKVSSLDRSLRGDLEIIVAKALEKDRLRRYRSVTALADDVLRFLHNEPILARAPSVTYKFTKFARRNTSLVTTAVMSAVLLLGAIAWLVIAVHAKNSALKQAQASEKAANESAAQALASEAVAHRSAGRWAEVLRIADTALATGLIKDEVPLRLLKVEAWMATGQKRRAQEELTTLSKNGDRAEVILANGDSLLMESKSMSSGESLIRRALELGLGDADRAYAQALLVEKPGEFVAGMERAVALDPFSCRAQRMYAMGCFYLGRFDDMDRPLRFLEVMTPNDWDVPFIRATIAYIRGTPEQASEPMKRMDELAGQHISKVLGPVLETIGKVSRPALLIGAEKVDVLQLILGQLPSVTKGFELINKPGRAVTITLPPFLRRSGELAGASHPFDLIFRLKMLVTPTDEVGLARLAKVAETSELGIARFMLARSQYRFHRYADSLESYERAGKMDSFLNVRAAAWYGAVQAAHELHKQVADNAPQDAKALAERMSTAALETLRAGRMPTKAMAEVATNLALVGEHDSAKLLVYQLLRTDPKNLQAIYAGIKIERRDENFKAVVRLAARS